MKDERDAVLTSSSILPPSSLNSERAGGRVSGGSPAFSAGVMAEAGVVEVIINAAAGGSEKGEAARAVEAAFEACGVRARVLLARDGAEISELARRALSNGARTVVAGGGDGTVGSVAAELAGTDTALGVLPLGTLNHFAKDLGVPLDLDGAAALIAQGEPRAIDV